MQLRYGRYDSAYSDFRKTLHRLAREDGTRRALDVGGGANPQFSRETIDKYGLDYVLLDIDPEELEKAPDGYRTVCADITDPAAVPEGPFDLVFSTWVAEHVADPAAFHSSVLGLLSPGGHAVHLFPTLYAVPFVANRVIPDEAGERIVRTLTPGRRFDDDEGKFPALYRWCRGPTRRQIARLRSVGFEIEEYHGFFGHEYYKRIVPLHALQNRVADALVRRPVPAVTAWAMAVLRRPA